MAAQEGVSCLFQAYGGWKGGYACGAQGANLDGAYPQKRVVGLAGQCEADVGLGIFVGTIDQGIVRQGGQALQGAVQLFRRPFEYPAAAAAEQGVAAEDIAISRVGDMAARVTPNIQHFQGDTQFRQVHGIPLGKQPGGVRDALGLWGIYRDVVYCAQFVDAADMVAMVVSAQNGGKVELPCIQPR